jgi:hypothetical protein
MFGCTYNCIVLGASAWGEVGRNWQRVPPAPPPPEQNVAAETDSNYRDQLDLASETNWMHIDKPMLCSLGQLPLWLYVLLAGSGLITTGISLTSRTQPGNKIKTVAIDTKPQ